MNQLSRSELPSLNVPSARWLIGTWQSDGITFTELGWVMDGDQEMWNLGRFLDEDMAHVAVAALESTVGSGEELLTAAGFSPAKKQGGFSTGDTTWTGPTVNAERSFLVMAFNEIRIETWKDSERCVLASMSAFSSVPAEMLGSSKPAVSSIAALLAVLSARCSCPEPSI
jgi:hypothetical protein